MLKGIAGYTLLELQVGVAISVAVLSIVGYGLTSVTTSSTKMSSQTERRQELNRAADFITNEIRHAEQIVPDASVSSEKPRHFTPEVDARVTQVEPVLMLKMDETSSVSIIYYLATPPRSPWRGPKVIYRWGPNYRMDGNYENASDPTLWTHKPLIDLIEATGTLPNCTDGWIGNGSPGFYACVHPNGKIAQIHQRGQINKVLGQSDTYQHTATATTRTQKGSLASSLPTPPPSLPGSSPPPPPPAGNSCLLVMDEDSLDNDTSSVEQAARQHNTDPDTLINKDNPTERGNPVLPWNTRYAGDIVTIPTGQVGDEGLFTLPSTLRGKNGVFSLDNFTAGTVPQADLDEVRDVQPLGNTQINNLVGQSCLAIAYDSDVSINYGPLEANLQGERLGRFYFTVLGIESGPELDRLRIRIDPPP